MVDATPITADSPISRSSLTEILIRSLVVAGVSALGFAGLAFLASAERVSDAAIQVPENATAVAGLIGRNCLPAALLVLLVVELQLHVMLRGRWSWPFCCQLIPLSTAVSGALFAFLLFLIDAAPRVEAITLENGAVSTRTISTQVSATPAATRTDHAFSLMAAMKTGWLFLFGGPKGCLILAGGALLGFFAGALLLALNSQMSEWLRRGGHVPWLWYYAPILLTALFLGGLRGWKASPYFSDVQQYHRDHWPKEAPAAPFKPIPEPIIQ